MALLEVKNIYKSFGGVLSLIHISGGLSRRGAGGVPLGSGGVAGGWPRRVHRLGLCGGRAVSGGGYPCGTVSVSYTHLDVYKRQVDGAVAIKEVYPRLLASMKRISQMDYLDVYKRQY